MHILLSNDDGYSAAGLKALASALSAHVDITVVAPEANRSGASNSLTLEIPLRVSQAENGFYKVNGTPTDCVHLAITGLLDREPDMVFAGINLAVLVMSTVTLALAALCFCRATRALRLSILD